MQEIDTQFLGQLKYMNRKWFETLSNYVFWVDLISKSNLKVFKTISCLFQTMSKVSKWLPVEDLRKWREQYAKMTWRFLDFWMAPKVPKGIKMIASSRSHQIFNKSCGNDVKNTQKWHDVFFPWKCTNFEKIREIVFFFKFSGRLPAVRFGKEWLSRWRSLILE